MQTCYKFVWLRGSFKIAQNFSKYTDYAQRIYLLATATVILHSPKGMRKRESGGEHLSKHRMTNVEAQQASGRRCLDDGGFLRTRLSEIRSSDCGMDCTTDRDRHAVKRRRSGAVSPVIPDKRVAKHIK